MNLFLSKNDCNFACHENLQFVSSFISKHETIFLCSVFTINVLSVSNISSHPLIYSAILW